ncbi:hypothetical protein [Flavobacterium sp.]
MFRAEAPLQYFELPPEKQHLVLMELHLYLLLTNRLVAHHN